MKIYIYEIVAEAYGFLDKYIRNVTYMRKIGIYNNSVDYFLYVYMFVYYFMIVHNNSFVIVFYDNMHSIKCT